MIEISIDIPEQKSAVAEWLVYIIRADDGRLYTGITNDIQRRWLQHSDGRGAKFFRGRQPQALLFIEAGHDRSSALRREAAIKKLTRAAKLALIVEYSQKKPPA